MLHLYTHNPELKKQVILVMIVDNERQHYLAVKKLSTLFTGRI